MVPWKKVISLHNRVTNQKIKFDGTYSDSPLFYWKTQSLNLSIYTKNYFFQHRKTTEKGSNSNLLFSLQIGGMPLPV